MCSVYITNYNEIRSILIVIMSIPLSQLKVEQAHKEFNSLVDIVIAKYEQLDSAEFRVVGNLAFNAKSAELDVLFTCMNQLYQKLNLPMLAQLHRLPFFKHWRTLFGSKFVQYVGKQFG